LYSSVDLTVKFPPSFYFTMLLHLSIHANHVQAQLKLTHFHFTSSYDMICNEHFLLVRRSSALRVQCQPQSNIRGNHVLVHCHAEFDNPALLKWKDNFCSDLSCVQIKWLWRKGLSVRLCPTSEKSGLCWVSAYNSWLWYWGFWVQYLASSLCICEQIFLLRPSSLSELKFGNVKDTFSLHGWEGMLKVLNILC
jgi:hypothetical protein